MRTPIVVILVLVFLAHLDIVCSQNGDYIIVTESNADYVYATVTEGVPEYATVSGEGFEYVTLNGPEKTTMETSSVAQAMPTSSQLPYQLINYHGEPMLASPKQVLDHEAVKQGEKLQEATDKDLLAGEFDGVENENTDELLRYAEQVAKERESKLRLGQQFLNGTWVSKPYNTTFIDPRVQKWLRLHANYAAAAYCFKFSLLDWSCPDKCVGNMNVLQYFSSFLSGVAGYVGVDRDLRKIVVAFRGSLNLRNWIYNTDIIRLPLHYPGASPGVRVHGGFLKAYQGLKNQVRQGMEKVFALITKDNEDVSDYQVIVTGHSLGAAVAVHGALDIRQYFLLKYRLDPEKFFLHTYASPRAGNKAFGQLVLETFSNGEPSLNLIRVTNNADPVPHVPPVLFGYSHYPHEVWVRNVSSTEAQTIDCKDKLPIGFREDPHCNGGKLALNIAEHTRAWDLIFSSSTC
ncbi:alpha/beta-hydrolase [Basidiobolus meristosporus CBS 931.73]|uniref:Alpha/beta-hydrolase n=1 Tax=Basidiobolus meristosporus CBS 931.73 TaxID=1314790 RepID=A0A1Y1YBC8_9FUNG|nr:alpha/beta-hydrolase [Basidiobolus meristosporus CBS 931.73]|eukprot:ORX95287.1 alpha/beta-hydrolase [Basidiobolus meristosporus CBS 931.73]